MSDGNASPGSSGGGDAGRVGASARFRKFGGKLNRSTDHIVGVFVLVIGDVKVVGDAVVIEKTLP
jgi:hypothetical protein